jgi:hypothetical protein
MRFYLYLLQQLASSRMGTSASGMARRLRGPLNHYRSKISLSPASTCAISFGGILPTHSSR